MKTVHPKIMPRIYGKQAAGSGAGFTLLEVLVALVVLAVGVSLTMSVITGSLGNVRKSQLRTRLMTAAQTIMESSLYREDLQQPTTYSEDLSDGYRCIVQVEEYHPDFETEAGAQLPVKLLQYRIEMIGPDSTGPLYTLETLKLVTSSEERQ